MEKNNEIREKIINSYTQLSIGEKKVAKYIIDHFSETLVLSCAELASKASVSNATVIRFSQSLGYKGYLELKRNLKEKNNITRNPYDYLKKMESQYSNGFIDHYLTSLNSDLSEFISNLDYSLIDQMAFKLLNASTVYLVGIGSDSVMATFLNNYLGLMDINTKCIREGGLPLKEALYQLEPHDVILMSGYPQILKDEKWVADFCEMRGAELISITDSPTSGAYLKSTLNISVKENVDTFFNSCVLPLAVCNVLLLRLYEKAPDRVESSLQRYSEILSEEEV